MHNNQLNIQTNKCFGFTFIEILIVTIILSVLAAITFPKFRNSYDAFQFKAQIDQFKLFCDYSRDIAILKKTPLNILIDFENKTYKLRIKNFTDNKPSEEWRRISGRPGKLQNISYYIQLESDSAEITFYPDGTASEFYCIWTGKNNVKYLTEMNSTIAEMEIEKY